MRLSRIDCDRGGVAVFFVLALPLMVASLIVLVDIGRIAVARARLQAACDRAAYAGAASIAHSMNGIAAANWRIHKAFRDLRDDFAADSQQEEAAARQRIDEYEGRRDAELAAVREILDAMEERSRAATVGVLEANAPGASAEFLYEGVTPPAEDIDPDVQSEEVDYSYISGDIFIDPEDVEGGSYEALKYLIKESGAEARVGLIATTRVEPLTLGTFIGDGIDVQSFSAAQAFGGSIEEFAEQGAEGIDVAEGWVTDDGYDALYRASLVPGWTLGIDGVNH